jgi:hypothetical protein
MSDQRGPISALPEGWGKMLDTIDARLQEAITAADARMPTAESAAAPTERRTALERLGTRRQELDERRARAQAVASEVDALLAAGEEAMRQRLAEVESLRQRLASWTARGRQ